MIDLPLFASKSNAHSLTQTYSKQSLQMYHYHKTQKFETQHVTFAYAFSTAHMKKINNIYHKKNIRVVHSSKGLDPKHHSGPLIVSLPFKPFLKLYTPILDAGSIPPVSK